MEYENLNSGFRKPRFCDTFRWAFGLHDEKRFPSPSGGVYVPHEFNDGKALRTDTSDTLTWIGQASFLLQLGGQNILIDPVLSKYLGFVKRNSPVGLDYPALPRIDAVFLTHNHRDHMDEDTIRKLGPDLLYVVPKGLSPWFYRRGFTRIIEMGWWEKIDLNGVTVEFVPAEHWSRRGLFDVNLSWWGGYVFEKDGLKIYHSGDTGKFDGFELIARRHPDIHTALLPVGACEPRWFMSPQHIGPQEAVDFFELLGARNLFAMHWGTFKLSNEPLDEPPRTVRKLFNERGLSPDRLDTGTLGKTVILR